MLVCFRKGRKCSLPSGVAVCAPYGMSETTPILKFNLRCGAAHPANRSLQVRRWCFAVVGTVGEGTHNRAHWASLSCWVSPDHGTAPHSAAMGYRSLILLALFAARLVGPGASSERASVCHPSCHQHQPCTLSGSHCTFWFCQEACCQEGSEEARRQEARCEEARRQEAR